MTVLPPTTALVLEPRGSVLTVWLNRPETKNALSAAMVDELGAVLDAIRRGDASLARAAMFLHLNNSRERMKSAKA